MDSTETHQPGSEAPQPAEPDLITSRHRWIDLGLVLLIAIVPSVINAVSYWLFPQPQAMSGSNWSFAGGLFHQASGILVLAYVISRQQRTWKSIGFTWRWSDPLIAFFLLVAALVWL